MVDLTRTETEAATLATEKATVATEEATVATEEATVKATTQLATGEMDHSGET